MLHRSYYLQVKIPFIFFFLMNKILSSFLN
jgi:hypothetical protein